MPVWYYDKKELKISPSTQSGITYEDEIRYRREGARFIQELGKSLGLRHDTMATASIYFHRFYLFHSFISFPRYVTATCALFLAGKAEETPKKCRDIMKNVKELLNSHQFATFGVDPREEVMTLERVLLQTIKFDLQVDHPYSKILKYAKCLKGDQSKLQKMVQMSWTFVNDSLCTTLCLQWEPEVIAIALMYLAAKLSKFEVKDWKSRTDDHRNWWDQYVRNLTTDILEDICHQVLDLYSSQAKCAKEAPPSPPPGSRPPPPSIPTPRSSSSTPSGSYKQQSGTPQTPLARPPSSRTSSSSKATPKPPPPHHDGTPTGPPKPPTAAPIPPHPGKMPPMPPTAPPPKSVAPPALPPSLPPGPGVMPPSHPPPPAANSNPPPPAAPMMYNSPYLNRNQQAALMTTGYGLQAPPPSMLPVSTPPPNLSAPPPSGYRPPGAPPTRLPGTPNTPSPMASDHRRYPPPPSTPGGPPPHMTPRGPPPNIRGPPPDTSRPPMHGGPPLQPPPHHRGDTPTKDGPYGPPPQMGNNIRPPMPMMNMSPGLRQHSTPPQPIRGGLGGPPPPMGGMNTPRGPYQQNMGGGKMGQQGNNQGRGTPYQRPPQGGGQSGYQPRPPHGNQQRWN